MKRKVEIYLSDTYGPERGLPDANDGHYIYGDHDLDSMLLSIRGRGAKKEAREKKERAPKSRLPKYVDSYGNPLKRKPKKDKSTMLVTSPNGTITVMSGVAKRKERMCKKNKGHHDDDDEDDEDDDDDEGSSHQRESAMMMHDGNFNGLEAAQLLVGMVPGSGGENDQGRSMRAYKKKGVLLKAGGHVGFAEMGVTGIGSSLMGPPVGGLGTPFFSANSSQRQTRGGSLKALPANKRGGLRVPAAGPSGLTPNLQLMELASPSFFQSPFKNANLGGPSPGFGFTPGNHYTFGTSPQSESISTSLATLPFFSLYSLHLIFSQLQASPHWVDMAPCSSFTFRQGLHLQTLTLP